MFLMPFQVLVSLYECFLNSLKTSCCVPNHTWGSIRADKCTSGSFDKQFSEIPFS